MPSNCQHPTKNILRKSPKITVYNTPKIKITNCLSNFFYFTSSIFSWHASAPYIHSSMHPTPCFYKNLVHPLVSLLSHDHLVLLPVCDSHPAVYSPVYPGLLSTDYLPTSLLASIILSTSFPLAWCPASPNHAPLSSAYLVLPSCLLTHLSQSTVSHLPVFCWPLSYCLSLVCTLVPRPPSWPTNVSYFLSPSCLLL